MARRPFLRRKSNQKRNKEAMDVFKLHNTLHPGTRTHYLNVVAQFADFLLLHKKSLWDVTPTDALNFINQYDGETNVRSILQTFYRVLIDAEEYERENPIVLLRKREALERKSKKGEVKAVSEAEKVIAGLDETATLEVEKREKTTKPRKKKKFPKPIMTIADLEKLLSKTRHIRERAILELLFATGARLKEIVNLNVSDIDLEGKKILFFESNTEISRAIAIPKRTLAFLKVYERWRFRQLSPSNAYFISKRTKERLSASTVSTWLHRLQRGVPNELRWTANDFRKRSILHHYWLTKDLAAVTRFAGFKRPEATLRLINQVLIDRGIESIDELGKLPEFEELEKDRKRIAPTIESSTSITINLDPDELEMLRRSGLTPTQAVRTIFSLKDLYSAVAPVAAAGGAVASAPASRPSSGPSKGGPSGGPSGGPAGAIKPLSLGTPAAGAPALGKAPALGSAPSLGSPPALSSKPSPSPAASAPMKAPPRQPMKAPPARPPGAAPAGGQANFLGELKMKLAARRKAAAEAASSGESSPQKEHFSGVQIVDAPGESKPTSPALGGGPDLGGGTGPKLGGSPSLGGGSPPSSGPSLGGSPKLGGSPSLGGAPSGPSGGPSLGGAPKGGPSLGGPAKKGSEKKSS